MRSQPRGIHCTMVAVQKSTIKALASILADVDCSIVKQACESSEFGKRKFDFSMASRDISCIAENHHRAFKE